MRIVMFVTSLWLVTSPLWGKIVFYTNRDGNDEIYRMNSDGSNLTQLTFNNVHDWVPTWSPNGQQIVYTSNRDGNAEVYVMDADGTNQQRLTRYFGSDADPDWSPDGTQIAFVSDRNSPEGVHVFVMDTDGSNVRQVTDLFSMSPKWSPDGQWILFRGGLEGAQIYTIRPDGTDQWQVSKTKRDKVLFMGGWSPDGKKIVYAEAEKKQRAATPIITTRYPTRRRVFTRVPVEIPLKGHYTFSFSADGKSLLFAGKRNDDEESDIYRFRLDDRQLIQLTDTPGNDCTPREWNPLLSASPQRLTPTLWGEIKETK